RETMEELVDVETECRNRCFCRIGLGRSKTRRHLARGRHGPAATLHVGPDTRGSAELDSNVAESVRRSSRRYSCRAIAWGPVLCADACRFFAAVSGQPADAVPIPESVLSQRGQG